MRSSPLPTALLVAIEAGATAVIQPGGSMRDDEVIKAADDAGIAMVFTGCGIPALLRRPGLEPGPITTAVYCLREASTRTAQNREAAEYRSWVKPGTTC